MTLLSPLLKLFSDAPAERLATVLAEPHPQGDGSLEEILRRGEELKNSQQKDTMEWAGRETAEQIKRQIEAGTGLNVDKVEVKLAVKKEAAEGEVPEYDKPTITSVKIMLGKQAKEPTQQAKQESSSSASGGISTTPEGVNVPRISVKQVEPVEIQVGSPSEESEPREGDSKAVMNSAAEHTEDQDQVRVQGQELKAVKERIYELIGGNWGIERSLIRIVPWTEDSSG